MYPEPVPEPPPGTAAAAQVYALRNKINQTQTDITTMWLTGVTPIRHSDRPDEFGANGKTFDDFGDALDEARDRDR